MPDEAGRIRPNSNKQKARAANVAIFGRAVDKTETSGDYATMKNKLLPKSHTDMRNVFAHVNKYIQEFTGDDTPGVSPLHKNTIIRLYNTAMREPFKNISYVKCPKCKKEHEVICPICDAPHEIVIPEAQFEKNSLVALCKLADKTSPNLAAITQDINVNFLVTTFVRYASDLINRRVPVNERARELQELHLAMTQAAEADYTEVPNDGN